MVLKQWFEILQPMFLKGKLGGSIEDEFEEEEMEQIDKLTGQFSS